MQNIYKIKQLGTPMAPVRAKHNDSEARKASSSTAQGLSAKTLLAKGSEMLLTVNLWNEVGLTNGTKCTVKYIIYAKDKYGNQRKPPEVPDMVLVHVPQYEGPSFLDEPKIVPVVPMERSWTSNKKTYTRTMIPLLPAYAMSIHKSQGMTLDKVRINLGDKEFASGLTYTAVSRCKKVCNLAFDPYPNYLRFRDMFAKKPFTDKLAEENKILLQEIETIRSGSLLWQMGFWSNKSIET